VNRALRESMVNGLGEGGELFAASPRLSLDNGAMVARAAAFHLGRGQVEDPELTARADLPFPGMTRGGPEPATSS